MEDLNKRYYKSEGSSWIIFLVISYNKYAGIDSAIIPYMDTIGRVSIFHISIFFALLFAWSQFEYLQSNIKKTKFILIRNYLLWILLAITASLNVNIQGYTKIEIFAWIVGCFVLGLFLGITIIIFLMNFSAIFIKKYSAFISYNLGKITLKAVLLYFIYYLFQKYVPFIILSNIVVPVLITGIVVSFFNFKHKNFSNFQKFIHQNLYMKYLHKFGEHKKNKMAHLFKEAFEQNVVINQETCEKINIGEDEQKEIIKQIKKGGYEITQEPKEIQQQAINEIKNINFSDKKLPIYTAVCNRNLKEVKRLLETNKNPNNEEDNGWTPLLMSVANRCHNITNILLDNGADPDKANLLGITPLLYACRYDDLATIKKLIEYGADTECMSVYGESLLMKAADVKSKEIVLYLLSKGYTLKIKKAIKIAEKNGNGEIAKILRKHKKIKKL